jgi:UDP-N-acetylmuramoyl-tripeptide--D-alanyl-D-alanine ligase
MNYLTGLLLIFLIPLTISIVRNVLEDIYTWQIKEYRWDRISAYLKYDSSKKFRGFKYNFIRIILLLSTIFFFIVPFNIFLIVPVVVLIINTLFAIKSLREFLNGKFVRPKIKSIRNLLIMGIVLIFNVLIIFSAIKSVDYVSSQFPDGSGVIFDESYSISQTDFVVQEIDEPFTYFEGSTKVIPFALIILFIWVGDILFIDLIQPVLVSLGVGMTWPMSSYKRKRTIKLAKQKLKNFPKLKIVGITGSFGKTSTKEILFDILSHKYKTLMTPGNFNTSVGIAETILNELNDEHEVFIVEMGAYTMGEIKESAKLTPPHISVITNIGKSHLDIFGNVENILKAKSEIYTHLRKRGTAIVNSDNEKLFEYSKSLEKTKIFFGTKEQLKDDQVYMSNIEWNDNTVEFEINYKNQKTKIKTVVVGRHQIYNLLAAIAVALQLKITQEEIKEILKNKELKSSHFTTYTRDDGTLVIDDAYNSNPDGFNSALEYLHTYKKKRIVVTRGLQEVGSEIAMIYSDIVERIVDCSDVLITTDPTLQKYIENYDEAYTSFYFEDEDLMNEKIKEFFGEKNAILIEGRLSPETMKVLKTN